MPRHVFIHIGDTHLQSTHPRNADRLQALDDIIFYGRVQPSLAAWLWPGDLFHARSTPDDRNALIERVRQMAAKAPVVICYGNHDQPGDLDVLGKLATAYPVHVVARPEILSLRTATNILLNVFVLPYPTRAGLLLSGASSEEAYEQGRGALEAICREIGACRPELMIGHVNVAGSMASTGQPQIGREIELSAAALASVGCIPRLLNHIHRAQALHGASYAGSICRMDWGEAEEKSFSVVTLDDSEDTWTWQLDRVSLQVPPRYHLEGELTRDGFVVTANAASEPYPLTWAGCEVRVRYRFRASERSVLLSDDVIREQFKDAAVLALDPVAVPDRALRAPEVARATTLPEKLAAWALTSGVALPASCAARVDQLQRESSDTVLAGVARALESLEHTASDDATMRAEDEAAGVGRTMPPLTIPSRVGGDSAMAPSIVTTAVPS